MINTPSRQSDISNLLIYVTNAIRGAQFCREEGFLCYALYHILLVTPFGNQSIICSLSPHDQEPVGPTLERVSPLMYNRVPNSNYRQRRFFFSSTTNPRMLVVCTGNIHTSNIRVHRAYSYVHSDTTMAFSLLHYNKQEL